VRRGCERCKDQVPQMRCHLYSAGGLRCLPKILVRMESNEVRIPSTLVSVMALLGEIDATYSAFIL
jgi:hypothetical protein